MAAGRYRKRITIEQPARAANADGQLMPTWSPYATLWADVAISGSGQGVRHRQQQSRAGALFTVRWSEIAAGITPAMRIQHAGGTYHVETAEAADGPRREILIQTTSRRGADG